MMIKDYKKNNCVIRLWRKSVQQKYQSDNTCKIIVSQDFGENKYNKNIRVTIQKKIIVLHDFGANSYRKKISE